MVEGGCSLVEGYHQLVWLQTVLFSISLSFVLSLMETFVEGDNSLVEGYHWLVVASVWFSTSGIGSLVVQGGVK